LNLNTEDHAGKNVHTHFEKVVVRFCFSRIDLAFIKALIDTLGEEEGSKARLSFK
jgi:hypothetical protein